MNRKFMLNAAVAVLVALGLAACSSGGSTAAKSSNAKKPSHHTPNAKKPSHHTPNALGKAENVNHVYGAAVAFNENDGSRVLSGAKTLVEYSDAKELIIKDKKVVVMDRYAFDFMMVEGQKYQTIAKYNPVGAKDNTKSAFVTLGHETMVKDIPTSGSVTYKGKAYGASLVPHGHLQGDTQADVTVDVDFMKKTVAFKTENTMLNNKKNDSLNLMGSAKLDAAKNQFVEGVVGLGSSGRSYKGTLEGHFYGLKAEEVGGTFNVEGGYFIGGFGAKK